MDQTTIALISEIVVDIGREFERADRRQCHWTASRRACDEVVRLLAVLTRYGHERAFEPIVAELEYTIDGESLHDRIERGHFALRSEVAK